MWFMVALSVALAADRPDLAEPTFAVAPAAQVVESGPDDSEALQRFLRRRRVAQVGIGLYAAGTVTAAVAVFPFTASCLGVGLFGDPGSNACRNWSAVLASGGGLALAGETLIYVGAFGANRAVGARNQLGGVALGMRLGGVGLSLVGGALSLAGAPGLGLVATYAGTFVGTTGIVLIAVHLVNATQAARRRGWWTVDVGATPRGVQLTARF